MKPISVEFQCFGPYMKRQFVDFDQLGQNGIFLICGETGAGKTTILDAMCVALYGSATGSARGGLEEMRCKLAGKDDETVVDLIFDNGGKRYRFRRSLRAGRTNLIDEHQCMEWRDGEWAPLLANPKKTAVNARAEEIIGLSYDQFRQVIILPQGDFQRLLTSKSEEKEAILTKLFHTERWDHAVDEVYRRVKARDSELREEFARITAVLDEFGCGSLAMLSEKTDAAAKELDGLEAEAAAARAAEAELAEAQKKALLDDSEFRELARREKMLADLLALRPEMEAEQRAVEMADAADGLRPCYAAYQAARENQANALAEWGSAQAALKAAQERKGSVVTSWVDHEAVRGDYDRQKRYSVLLENAREQYRSIAELRQQRDQLLKQQKEAEADHDGASRSFGAADAAWQEALQALSAARKAYQDGQAAYLGGIGGILAEKLKPGVPCPVCGSTEHPAPAAKGEHHISDAELDLLAQREKDAINREVDTRERRKGAEAARSDAAQALSEAASRAAGAAAALEHAEKGMLEGIDSASDLEQAIGSTAQQIDAFEQAESALRRALEDAQKDEALAAGSESRLADAFRASEEKTAECRIQWESALSSSPFADEAQFLASCMEPDVKRARQEKCTEYRTDLNRARAEVAAKRLALQGKTAPDMDAVNTRLQAARDHAEALGKAAAVRRESLDKMRSGLSSLTEQKKTYDAERQAVDSDLDFANKLRGAAGVSLQRYLLGVRLSAITAAANRLLETVYGGRYRIYRTDEASGKVHKKGLELEVYDTSQNQRRSVNTLSGGEKFLVALSLAIGLSAVVRASGNGVNMEAMFVDEGFGSLDDKAVDDAVEILHGIHDKAGAVVGIISHVSRLEEILPTKLEAKKVGNESMLFIRS